MKKDVWCAVCPFFKGIGGDNYGRCRCEESPKHGKMVSALSTCIQEEENENGEAKQ